MSQANSMSRASETFAGEQAARKYARSLVGTKKNEREIACMRKGLARLKPGHKVIDIPCGTGRALPTLSDLGFRVTAADVNHDMVESAKGYTKYLRLDNRGIRYETASVFDTPFEQYEFDGVLCNRLFHHFVESETRVKAFRELRRICAGPIVVSFFCSYSYGGLTFHSRELLRSKKANDRIPITLRRFRQDAERAGLSLVSVFPSRNILSKQWYCVFEEWYQLRKPLSAFVQSDDQPRYSRPSKYEELTEH